MPFETHDRLVTPPDEVFLWRYMDFARFLSLLERKALWFSRADQFEDPLEGTFTDAELAYLREHSVGVVEPQRSQMSVFVGMAEMMRSTTFINCWRYGNSESLAMWDLYGKGSGIVAVKTTVGALKRQFAATEHRVMLGAVQYVPWDSATWPNNSVAQCVRKDLSYSHESEMRAIIWPTEYAGEYGAAEAAHREANIPKGLSIPVDVGGLISEVVVGPREHAWVSELVRDVLTRYGLSAKLTSSDRLRKRTNLVL